eukprot:Phypoly_transcript_08762.p1 GENE.Phypoly_transcript_08762~~Phypoly_transcript_08762.p1  ORF type:complete len:322 (+),score=44.07 Phypoly_transcript_08762:247-1212(+)
MADHEAQREQEVKDMHDSDASVGGKDENGAGEEKGQPAIKSSGDVDQKDGPSSQVGEEGEVFDPLSKLKEDQMEALEKMRLKASKYCTTDEAKEWCNDMCLLRYLRARDYHVKKAKKLLKGTIEWRFQEMRPHDIKIEDIEPIARLGVVYTNGFDKKGRPIIYGRPYKEAKPSKEITSDMKFRNLLYWLEQGFTNMDQSKGVETFCLITDYKDYSRKHMDMKTNMNVMHALLNHAPERMGITFFLDPPFLFWMGWKMISPFLNEVTLAKVRFVYSEVKDGKRTVPAMLEYIDAEQLEAEFGGTCPKVWDYDSYLKNGYKIV